MRLSSAPASRHRSKSIANFVTVITAATLTLPYGSYMTDADTMFFTGYAVFAVAVALAVLMMRWQGREK